MYIGRSCKFDFGDAYDTIRGKLLEILKEFKILPKLIKLVKLTLKNVRFKVKIENNLQNNLKHQ